MVAGNAQSLPGIYLVVSPQEQSPTVLGGKQQILSSPGPGTRPLQLRGGDRKTSSLCAED